MYFCFNFNFKIQLFGKSTHDAIKCKKGGVLQELLGE